MNPLKVALGAVALTATGAAMWLFAVLEEQKERRKKFLEKNPQAVVEALFIYPVKSLAGVPLSVAFTEPRGFQHDRRWVIVDKKGVFLSQRRCRKMTLIQPGFKGVNTLVLEKRQPLGSNGKDTIEVPLVVRPSESHPTVNVSIWEKDVPGAIDQGREVAEWLEDALSMKGVRLAYMPSGCVRPVNPKRAKANVSFADGYPFYLASSKSLKDLNERIQKNGGAPVPMDRFRPNIVIGGTGLEAWEEDSYKFVDILGYRESSGFRVTKQCERCIVTTIDQNTAKLGGLQAEPIATMKTFREKDGEVVFGVNMVLRQRAVECPFSIAVGDAVVLSS